MFVFKLIYRLYLFYVNVSALLSTLGEHRQHAKLLEQPPAVGLALRQGRRLTMEGIARATAHNVRIGIS